MAPTAIRDIFYRFDIVQSIRQEVTIWAEIESGLKNCATL
jgi:hypothetical protein